MAKGEVDSKARMILATLDLLRGSGLTGTGVNSIVAMSGAPKGSVYHFFPTGKHGLVAAALDEAEKVIGDGFRRIFSQKVPVSEKICGLFESTAALIEAGNFMKGCPVAAVTLDIDDTSEDLRVLCGAVFDVWRNIIASGLDDVPASERDGVAQLILASLEGALVLSRAQASPNPLTETGALLATTLARAFEQRSDPTKLAGRANTRRGGRPSQ
jgi:TetR/AcrR family transcriptional repressor of lmrAB and yxaGH operons